MRKVYDTRLPALNSAINCAYASTAGGGQRSRNGGMGGAAARPPCGRGSGPHPRRGRAYRKIYGFGLDSSLLLD
jgi:hypothetical protein